MKSLLNLLRVYKSIIIKENKISRNISFEQENEIRNIKFIYYVKGENKKRINTTDKMADRQKERKPQTKE
jgi:hypothetical protein